MHLGLMSISIILAFSIAECELTSSNEPKLMRTGPRPLKDRFLNIHQSLSKSELSTELDVFKSYGCEHMVSISNEVTSPLVLWCSSGDEDIKEIQVIPEESFAFTFRPKKNGQSVFQCVLNFEEKWVTFAVYNEEELYSVPRENSYVYRYTMRSDGIYMNKHKIKSFFKAFDSSSDYYDYSYDDTPDNVPQTSKAVRNKPKAANLSIKRDLIEAPKAVLDNFNIIRGNLSRKDNLSNLFQGPKVIVDRFNIIGANLSKEDLRTEIDDFANYDCEKMVVLSNNADYSFRLWCSSGDEDVRDLTLATQKSFVFSFKPKINGNSKFQCILDYKGKWATFDVFNMTQSCTCKQMGKNNVYQYSIRHYGVYSEDSTKIKSLFNGRNQYTLWESYNDYNEMPYGKLMTGYVDGPDDCTTVPGPINDKPAAITVCDRQCVVAYQHIKCVGQRQVVQAYDNRCKHVKLWNGLYKDLSSVKGC